MLILCILRFRKVASFWGSNNRVCEIGEVLYSIQWFRTDFREIFPVFFGPPGIAEPSQPWNWWVKAVVSRQSSHQHQLNSLEKWFRFHHIPRLRGSNTSILYIYNNIYIYILYIYIYIYILSKEV